MYYSLEFYKEKHYMSAVDLSSVMMQWIIVMVYIFVKSHPINMIYPTAVHDIKGIKLCHNILAKFFFLTSNGLVSSFVIISDPYTYHQKSWDTPKNLYERIRAMVLLSLWYCPRGPSTNHVDRFLGIFDPLPLCLDEHFTKYNLFSKVIIWQTSSPSTIHVVYG